MSVRLFILILLFPAAHSAAESFSGLNLPASLLRNETFAVPKSIAPAAVDGIIYGNSSYGFFKVPATLGKNGISAEFFPPGYIKPIEFYVALKNSGERHFLGSRKFNSPFAKAKFSPPVERQGTFSRPYFISTWFLDADTPVPLILNREGEPVWAAAVTGARSNVPARGYVPLKIAPEKILILGGVTGMSYWQMDAKSGTGPVTQIQRPGIFHHVFDYLKDSNELIALGYDCRPLSWWEENSPAFAGVFNWIKAVRLPRRTYAGASIIRVNLTTGESRQVWTTADSFPYKTNPSLSLLNDMDRFLDVKSPGEYMALKRSPALTVKNFGVDCDVDWSHDNSVRFYPGQGYLVSIRNLNKVVMIGEDGKLKWSLGGKVGDTYRIRHPQDQFSMQHDAWLIGSDRVLLFDNHVPYRGWLDKRFDKPSRIAQYHLTPGRAVLEWSFVLPAPRADIRGTVHPLADGRVLAFDPGMSGRNLRFFELARNESGLAAAYMEIGYPYAHRPLEARPIDSIAGEKFIPEMSGSETPPQLRIEAVMHEVLGGY